MSTNKRTLTIATLSLFALATPAFAANYGGGSNAMSEIAVSQPAAVAATPQIAQWDGGGSNAMSQVALSRSVKSAPLSDVAQWDGGGSNAMGQTLNSRSSFVSSNPIRQKVAASASNTPWDGGGSNAISEDSFQLTCAPASASAQQKLVKTFRALDVDNGSDAMRAASNIVACAGAPGNDLTLQENH